MVNDGKANTFQKLDSWLQKGNHFFCGYFHHRVEKKDPNGEDAA